ncbi:GNAT family N-acetyltransferase [Fodinicurvata sediminis]|uniref:GNAT family N-acetyltransferase n=1 Tax=Fodinicurvata sediminis TaxID=1121832 RepID=UPI0003B75D6C|nr:GNAT family N-acetyltransferase [Fodinicurvata sediminis]
MALTSQIATSVLDESHLPDLMALSREAGWNQVENDWHLFLTQGRVFCVLDDGQAVGSAAILPYGDDFAWIGMVLVRGTHRKQGVGTRLLERCLEELDSDGRAACLDATPAGEPIYRTLGFEGSLRLTRWQGEAGGATSSLPDSNSVPLSQPEAFEAAVALDAAALGAERRPLLSCFARRLPEAAWMTEDGSGAILGRNGDLASQIGPLLAEDEQTAITLLDTALGQLSGRVFLDVVDTRQAVADHLQARGFTQQRPYLRMTRNADRAIGDATGLHAIAGPEFG